MNSLALTSIEGWTLATSGFADGQPRVRDLELAEHLGYERPRKIRDLLRDLVAAGKLKDSEVCTTAGQTSPLGGRPSTEYWLTEAQALKVVAKSETAKADAILDEVIRVFIAVRQAPAALVNVEAQMMARFEALVAPFTATMTAMAKAMQDLTGCTISDIDAKWLSREVKAIAKLRAMGSPTSKGENSERRYLYNKLGAAVSWTGSGRRWSGLPASKVAEARAALAEMRKDALRAFPNVASLQLSLPEAP